MILANAEKRRNQLLSNIQEDQTDQFQKELQVDLFLRGIKGGEEATNRRSRRMQENYERSEGTTQEEG